jgi:glutaredoxin
LGVEREEFTASVAQFFRAEAQRFPIFLVTEPGNEDGEAMKKVFEEEIGVSTRTYEVYGFDEMKMKVKADYDWKEARVDALELVTGSRALPQVFIGGNFFGDLSAVKSAMKSGTLAEACADIKAKQDTKKDAEINTKEVVMSGMRIIDEEADKIKAERMVEIEKLRKEKGY